MEQLEIDFMAGCEPKKFTKEEVLERIHTSKKGACVALWALYDEQSPSEKRKKMAIDRDGKGFNRFDAKLLSEIAVITKRENGVTVKELEIIRRRLPKYARQLTAIANRGR